jgi:hypothetical protein
MTSILKVSTIQNTAGAAPTAADLGLNVAGSVVQVVQTHFDTESSTTTASWSTLYSASITPTSSSNKVLAVVSFSGSHTNNWSGIVRVLRDVTPIGGGVGGTNYEPNVWFNVRTATDYNISTYSASYLDSPATTSAITYNVQWFATNGIVFYANRTIQDSGNHNYDSPTASSITLMEIAQ